MPRAMLIRYAAAGAAATSISAGGYRLEVQAMMNGIPRPDEARLQLWTASDYPSCFVARLSEVGPGGA
jgi:hypothetical protein